MKKASEELKQEEAKQQLTPQFNEKLLAELKTKGFVEIPFEIALIKIEGKCYAVSVEALHDLEQELPEKWKDLEALLNKYGIIIPSEVEGVYTIPWKLLGRCTEWK